MRLGAATFPDASRGAPQADDQSVLLQAGEIPRLGGKTASGSDDGLSGLGQLGEHLAFQGAKGLFPGLGKNLRNGSAGAGFDEFVGIEKLEGELGGDQATDRGFARPHKADKGDISKLALVRHVHNLIGMSNKARGFWGAEFVRTNAKRV